MRATFATISALAALAAAQTGSAPCTCGYSVNSTTDPNNSALFTEIFESDFIHAPYKSLDGDGVWVPQAYNVTPDNARGPYGKSSEVQNVLTNPNGRVWDWNAPGIRGEDPGLQMWVKSKMLRVPNSAEERMVPMGEIVSARDDILYGSFRIGMKTSQVRGTCAAFFFYRNDSNEIDMEFLSDDQVGDGHMGKVNLVIQSPLSADVGYVQPGSADYDNHSLPFDPSEDYHEYRFDWLPDRVDFYADSQWMSTIKTNVPHLPGAIHVSHWSNGNADWSGGPPQEDALLTVSYIKAYFNSSNLDNTAKSLEMCNTEPMPNNTCVIPNQLVPPDPTGENGNSTGRTHFFTTEVPAETPSSPPPTPTATHRATPSSAGVLSAKNHLAVMVVAGLFVVMMGFCPRRICRAVYGQFGV